MFVLRQQGAQDRAGSSRITLRAAIDQFGQCAAHLLQLTDVGVDELEFFLRLLAGAQPILVGIEREQAGDFVE